MKPRPLLVLLFLLLAAALRPLAAAGEWAAWLYDPDGGRLLLVESSGRAPHALSLPVPQGWQRPQQVAIAAAADVAAYLLHHPQTLAQQLVIIDLDGGGIRGRYDLPTPAHGPLTSGDLLHLAEGPRPFTPDGRALAFSYRLEGEGWALIVLDSASGAVLYSLHHSDTAARAQPALHAGRLPVVQRFQFPTVSFTVAHDPGGRGLPILHSYVWDLLAGHVEETVDFPTLNTAAHPPAAESVAPLPDFRFSMLPLPRPQMPANTLHVHSGPEDGRFPFFHTEDFDLLEVIFIQNGERLLALARPDAIRRLWLVLERSGQIVRRLPAAGTDPTGTPDGFVYLAALPGNQAALVHVDTRAGDSGRTVWVGEDGWRIVRASGGLPGETLPWAALAEPALPPGPPVPGATPTLLPTPGPALYPGLLAYVQTLEDTFLNLRSAPSLSSAVLALLAGGSQLTLLEGPLEAEGFVWWKVRVGQREGWVVESLEDIRTIIPQPPVLPTPEETPDQ